MIFYVFCSIDIGSSAVAHHFANAEQNTSSAVYFIYFVVSCLNVYYIRYCLIEIHLEGEQNKVGVRRPNIFVALILQPVRGALIPIHSTSRQVHVYVTNTMLCSGLFFSNRDFGPTRCFCVCFMSQTCLRSSGKKSS